MKTTLTEKLIKDTPWNGKEARLVDQTLPGFYVSINKHTRTYKIKADLWVGTPGQKRKIRTVNQAICDATVTPLREARRQAAAYLMQIKAGTDPFKEPESDDISIGIMVEGFIASRREKNRRPATIESYEKIFKLYLKGVADESATKYELHQAYKLHQNISKNHGENSADRAIKLLSSAYRYTRPRTPPGTVDHNPLDGFDYNSPKARKGRTMTKSELAEWNNRVKLVKNPIRQDLHLTLLYSGLRKRTATELRHDWVDAPNRCLMIPAWYMKSDEELTLPLSDHLLLILQRASKNSLMMYPKSPWIFPTRGNNGEIKPIQVIQEKTLGDCTGHTLRRTYRTMAALAGVSDRDGDLLMGHTIAGIRGRYIDNPQLFGNLLIAQDTVTNFIIKHM